jgi:hypothetical protein
MRPITNKVKERFGTLKNYAKLKKINYMSLRIFVMGNRKMPKIERILKKDGFLGK